MSTMSGVVRLVLYLGLTLPLMAVQAAFVATGSSWAERLPRWYHRQCLKILGVRLVVLGDASDDRPTLFVSNHSSYLDITILGALLKASFIAKSEVASWPLFGQLAHLQRTVFVERQREASVRGRDSVATRLSKGDNLILFAEGTSSDGNRVLPFKSTLMGAATAIAKTGPLTVQPVSVTAIRLDGLPLGYEGRWLYAWYGDMDLATHLWQFVRAGRMTVQVEFHPAIDAATVGDRKRLTALCERAVARGVAGALTGRAIPGDDTASKSAASPAPA